VALDPLTRPGQHERVTGVLEADYMVVGAGAMGMAFADALIDNADVSVVMVDRRHGAGGHWLDAYPFVRLHQASAFYGVASTLLGGGRIQQEGPEDGRPLMIIAESDPR
jgi:choline dehydrogenase-like flavoprotein